MSILTWLIAGALTGWGASHVLANTRKEAVIFNVGLGVLGAVLAGWVVAPLVGVTPGLGVFALFVSMCGAAALLFCVHGTQQMMSR